MVHASTPPATLESQTVAVEERTFAWTTGLGASAIAGEIEAELGAFIAWCLQGRLAHP